MNRQLVTVVIPAYLTEPTELEKVSLTQILAVLHKHPITFMVPTDLDTTWYEDFCRGKADVHFERFNWKGHEAYGELLLSPEYYQRFAKYEYMLVHHMDSFVFRDELEKWCRMGYDFLSAVIFHPQWTAIVDQPFRKAIGFGAPEYFGNGGFALKKIDTFYRITSKYKFYIKLYNWIRRKRKKQLLEDLFVMQHFPKLSKFKVPAKELAQKFGAEYVEWEEQDLPFSNQNLSSLPFGVHGWIQFHPEFWKPSIRQFGYSV
ncbi:DUF5672 family protein [Hymenobacter sp. YC55]|uniref:DUF5672 family protein n=1 Tax=Hymenobacter sp. YC55 TaxID=3034019 RepID=UPI0023F75591|nr:DUF5672 family protein [Hymenobacter sp. YC55]MDF7813008.1 DUF5672 family protein [Hymenobacter sp. YC55]